MKHLIALSMKYIRRQKMRTFLTFMCITLSAFILATVCSYCNSIFQTLMNEEIVEEGLWEVDISSWIEKSRDRDKAFEAVKNHAVVDDYYGSKADSASLEADSGIAYFEISVNGKTIRTKKLNSYKGFGNKKLIDGTYSEAPDSIKYDTDADGVYLPAFFSEMGYSKGDTVTFSICPVSASFDEDSDIIKEARSELKERYGTEYTQKDAEFADLPTNLQNSAYKLSLDTYLGDRNKIGLDDIPVADEVYGEPVEYTVKIAGFTNYNAKIVTHFFQIVNTDNTDVNFTELGEKNPDIFVEKTPSMKIRLIDNCDYDEALKMLFTDLGYDYGTQFFDSYKFPHIENDTLLALEWKSPYAIYKILAIIVIPMLIVLLIAWFISRFVIDNAFEMAVQERSTHFAALRVMGASKTQIAFLVFAEALFYCFTAVPLGTIIALLLCHASFNSINNIGLSFFEYKASAPIMAIGVVLCLVAILISAYTSAMWAARKLSPAEALNFGKPKSKKRKFRKYKSKLDLSANKFLRRYTRKNIKTAKSRFVVSTVTMTLGVLMFTITILMGTYIRSTVEKSRDPKYYDLEIVSYYSSDPKNPTEMPDKYFSDKEVFSYYGIQAIEPVTSLEEKERELIDNKLKDPSRIGGYELIALINEGEYRMNELDKITGMSYAEFRDSGGILYNNCNLTRDHELEINVEEFPTSYKKLDDKPEVTLDGKKYNIIGISASSEGQGFILPIEYAPSFNHSYHIYLRVSDHKHYKEAERLFNEFTSKSSYEFTENMYQVGTGANEFINSIIKVLIGFLVSIWLVGILSMINSVNTSVLNRSRELMMLRSVGMSRKQLRKSVMLETIMFSATAAVTGTAVGVTGFILFVYKIMQDKSPAIWGMVALTIAISITVNIIISLVAAIPAIKNLGKVEAIAQAANG
ncbi:MAG: ABC transporter permease [Ruminococcus sp.]|uniref:ABC transporter permease n=1 Tax=Ruminococcus sp. TaxID=41978 RepID=UPI0025DB581D|nr:ABC transporter permease [Ruminococcus sp.]MCR5600709.1 ABC transporter permease [Ruminococcus sp.]